MRVTSLIENLSNYDPSLDVRVDVAGEVKDVHGTTLLVGGDFAIVLIVPAE